MASKPILYYLDWSPPSRAVEMTAALIGVDLEIKRVSLLDADHLKPEFVKVSGSFIFISFTIKLYFRSVRIFIDESTAYNSAA